jgi:hypothetical protein
MIKNKRAQLEARDAQIEAEGGFEVQRKEVVGIDVLSTKTLRKLTVNELVDKWNQLEGDYILLKWKLAMLISDKFKSKIEFGQFLQELRIINPNHPLCTIKQSTFYRYTRAARFCDRFKIYDLKEIGISPTAIYDLSEITNEPVVDYRFIRNIKNKNLPVSEIKRLIYQAHSITGELIPEPVQSSNKFEMEPPEQDFEHLEAIYNETQTMYDVIEEQGVYVQPVQFTSQPGALHVEPTSQLTEEDMVKAVLNLLGSFNIPSTKKLDIIKRVQDKITESEYVVN